MLRLWKRWRQLPRWTQAALGPLIHRVPAERLLGSRYARAARFVADAEHWPAQRSLDEQLERLRRLLQLAYERTVYYRQSFGKVGFVPGDLRSLTDLARLPTIDAEVLRRHADQMCTVPVDSGGIDRVSTGGTAGRPLHFYIGRDRSAIEYAYLVSSWGRVGYRPGTPMAVLRGSLVRPDRRGLYHEYDPVLRHHYYSSFHLSDADMGGYLDHMAAIGPCFLHVYPSTVASLARFLRRSGRRAPANILGIIAESENVYPDQRVMIEDVFGVRMFSCYGHSEKLVLAAECEHSTDYHVWPTYGCFELLDPEGRPVTEPGQRGEIVGTGFINSVMPFIRYRTGDFATYVADRCEACGREHPVIRDIRGHRTQEVLIATDGSEISWTSLNMHDETFLHVRQFQFLQTLPGQAVLRLVPASGFVPQDQQRILSNLGQRLDRRLRVEIELVESIPLSARGKAIYVDQRVPNPA